MRSELYDDLTYEEVRERLCSLRRLRLRVETGLSVNPYPLGGLQSRIDKCELILEEFLGDVS